MKMTFKSLHDYSNWLALAGFSSIIFASIGVTGGLWYIPAMLTAIGAAVRIKYGE